MPVARYNNELWYRYDEVEYLIERAVADERDACLKIRDKLMGYPSTGNDSADDGWCGALEAYYMEIRNRGKE